MFVIQSHTHTTKNVSEHILMILNDVVILSVIQAVESQFSHCELFVCRMMEPQCFSLSVTPPQKCGPPPNLRNGYVEVSLQNYFYYFSFHFFFLFLSLLISMMEKSQSQNCIKLHLLCD